MGYFLPNILLKLELTEKYIKIRYNQSWINNLMKIVKGRNKNVSKYS